jgi:uncharacterized protein (DUF2141 family)
MKKTIKTVALILVSIITMSSFRSDPPTTNTANVEVSIKSLKRASGLISIALCNDEKAFMSASYKMGSVNMPKEGPISFTFENVPQGKYSIRIFQDIDGDGKLTAAENGLPKEPFGFSQNPSMQYGPPTWQNTHFELKENVKLTIDLIKFEF